MARSRKAKRGPTVAELGSLPRLAFIAYASRCARRVQPLIEARWPGATPSDLLAIDTAIGVAERSGNGDPTAIANAAEAAATVRGVVGRAVRATERIGRSAVDAARAAARAVHGAVQFDGYSVRTVAYAVRAAPLDTHAAIRNDFDLVKVAATHERWTDHTAVPAEFFGPFWPDGAPEGWPYDEGGSDDCELVFKFSLPENASGEDVQELVVELAARLDGLHRALGGRGLYIGDVEVTEEMPVREGVRT